MSTPEPTPAPPEPTPPPPSSTEANPSTPPVIDFDLKAILVAARQLVIKPYDAPATLAALTPAQALGFGLVFLGGGALVAGWLSLFGGATILASALDVFMTMIAYGVFAATLIAARRLYFPDAAQTWQSTVALTGAFVAPLAVAALFARVATWLWFLPGDAVISGTIFGAGRLLGALIFARAWFASLVTDRAAAFYVPVIAAAAAAAILALFGGPRVF